MAFSNLTPTSTFAEWYTQTNEIATFLNDQIVANGQVAYGVFTLGANANVSLCNTVFLEEALLTVNTNATFGWAQSSVNFLSNTFTVASNNVLLNPITSVFVNTAMTVNAVSTFLANVVAVNVAASGTLTAPAARIDGNLTANNGTLIARQLLFTTNGATVNSTLSAVGYADYTTPGLEDANIWSATPSQNTVVSGIDAHTAVTSSTNGARLLYLQNLSTTSKITLSPANGSSTAQHQFETNNSLPVEVLPKTSVLLVYSKETAKWRVIGGPIPAGTAVALGNTAVTGVFTASGNTTLSANVIAVPLYVNQVTGRVGVGTATPSVLFHSVGPNLLEDLTTLGSLPDGSATATKTIVANSTNLLTAIAGYTGTQTIAGNTYTWRAGVLVSIS